MSDVVPLLRGIGALAGMCDEHLQLLAKAAAEVHFAPDTVIFREGDPAVEVFLIVAGEVALEICAPSVGCRRILTVADGELLGWSPVLEQATLTATARTQVATHAVKISGPHLLQLCDQDPRFGYELMRRAAIALAKRLSATRLQLLNVYGSEMPHTSESVGRA